MSVAFWATHQVGGPYETLEESQRALAERQALYPTLHDLMPVDLPGQTVLDYGCGSGILAIAAKRLGAGETLGVDIDPQAMVSSRFNADNNHADVRFVLPALLLLFAGPVRGVRPKRFDLLVPLLGCLLHTGIVWHRAVAIDRELADMATILDLLPARSNVLPLVSDQRRNGRIPAYRHFVQWHTINRQGRAPALFSGNGYGQHLAHFWIPDPLYHPGDHWGTRDFHALAWDRIREQYEFILQAGADARASTLIMEQAEPVARRGDVTLYRVRSGAPPGTTAGGRESGRQ